jgi:hypothetical protein
MVEWEEGTAAVGITEDLRGSKRKKKEICRTDLQRKKTNTF